MKILCDNIIMLLEKEKKKMDGEKDKEKKEMNPTDDNQQTKRVETIKDVLPERKKKIVNKNTQEYVDKMLKRRKKIMITVIVSIIVVFVLAIALTAFSITASLSNKIVNGVSINGIDVSGLTKEEATEKITNQINSTKIESLTLTYEDYTTTIDRNELNINLNVENTVNEAFAVGRANNIIVNNFKIISLGFKPENIELEKEYNSEMLNSMLDNISKSLPGLVMDYTYCIEDDELIITRGTAGIILDRYNLNQIILDRFMGNITTKNSNEVTIPVIDTEPKEIDIEAIYEEIKCEPQDAYIIEEPLEIVPEKNGVDLDITIEEAKSIINEEVKDEYVIPLKITKAQKTMKDLGSKAFPDQLAKYTTKYDASNRNRSTNLELAAEKINGTVLLPGEEFSYNKVVGKRTIENGYKEAAVYANGGVENGLGGGICQISTTLYNVALLANLEITERRNHTYTTSYEVAGRDATVVYGVQDFKFKNSREYPIKIVASVKNGIAMMKIMGIKEEVEYEVKIVAYKTSTIPYKTEKIENDSLTEGKEKVKQKGASGCKAVCYRELYLNGERVKRELMSKDTYSAMKRIVEVGTKKKTTTTKKDDTKTEEKEEETTKPDTGTDEGTTTTPEDTDTQA